MKDKKPTEPRALLPQNYGKTDIVKIPPYEPEPIVSSQSFLEAGGTATHPDLNLEGMIEVTLPKEVREKYQKEMHTEIKKRILRKLLIEEAKKKGYTHLFYRHFTSDYNTIIADGYTKKESDQANKGLVEQFEDWVAKNKLERQRPGDWFDRLTY